MDRITCKMKYSRKEHRKFYMFHVFHRSSSMKFVGIFLALMVLLLILNLRTGENITFTVVMFAITLGIIPIIIIGKVNDIVKKETPERLNSTDTVELTKHKIVRSTDITNGKATIGWNNVDVVCENDDYVYIYTTDETGLFIRKNAIIEGDIQLLRKIACDNLPLNKKGKVNYKRYGQVKKDYKREMKLKKQAAKKHE